MLLNQEFETTNFKIESSRQVIRVSLHLLSTHKVLEIHVVK